MLRVLFAGVLALFAVSCAAPVSDLAVPNPNSGATSDASVLVGTWQVDLRPRPNSDPYFQELVIAEVKGRSFVGTFYGTPVTQARINTDWHKVRIAFVTKDGSGDYHHSAVLTDETLDGLSNSTGRDFLSYWSARKAAN